MIDLPDRYKLRMVEGRAGLKVYGDKSRVVLLGYVGSQSEAMKLLDSYDNLVIRRRYIAEHILKGNEENEDAKQIAERLNHDIN